MPPKKEAPRNYLQGVSFGRSDHIPTVIEVALDNLAGDPNQPRKTFDEDELNNLAASIKDKGLLSPILVRRNADREGAYIVIAGERRLRASRLAGLPSIGCIVSAGDPAELALIENVQRVDLNPVEEAEAIERLISSHNYTHETVGKVLGKSRTTITETLSILKLPAAVLEQAKALNLRSNVIRQIVLMDEAVQKEAIALVASGEGLSVRTAKALKGVNGKAAPTPARLATNAMYASIERLSQIGSKPKIDEMKALREAKKRLDDAYKTATSLTGEN